MGNLALPQKQLADHGLSINGVADRPTHARIVQRRRGNIESEEIKVRARKLKDLQVLILFERVDGIRRKTRWQRGHVHPARSQFSLQCVHIADYADAKRGNSRRAVPIIRISFYVDNLLRRVVTLELERSGSKRVCFLRLVAVLWNHRNGY